MKNTTNRKNNMSKGVSTLDAIKNSLRCISSLLTLIILSSAIYSAPGHSTLDLVDPSFNAEVESGVFGAKSVFDVEALPDGKILVGGQFSSYNRIPTGTLIRLNSDGTLDTSFNTPLETVTGAENLVYKMAVQSDGKVIVAISNSSITIKGSAPKNLIRLNTDGSLDTSYIYNESLQLAELLIDDLDRLIVVGGSTNTFGIHRLSTNGSLDTSYQNIPKTIKAATLQGNKIIASTTINNVPNIERYNEDGTIDTSFISPPTSYSTNAGSLKTQPDGKILVGTRNSVNRLKANGELDDANFPPVSFPSQNPGFLTLGVLDDGKIQIMYRDANSISQTVRLLSDGTVDSSFSMFATFGILSFAIQSDGTVIIGDIFIGGANTGVPPNGFVKILNDGTADSTFNAGGIAFQSILPGSIQTLAVQPDDKVLIGGKFNYINKTLRTKLARLNADSTLDTSFQINTTGADNTFTAIQSIYHIALQADGKMLVSGNFTYVLNGQAKKNFVRLNSNGSIDNSFDLGVILEDTFGCCNTGSNKPVSLSNNKVIVGVSRRNLGEPVPIGLNANGSLDSSFNSTIFPNKRVINILDINVQTDEKIVLVGEHSSPGTINEPAVINSFVARLNADGSTDTTFQISEELNKRITDLALLPDGKILIVRENSEQSDVLRLNWDGTPDNSFDAGTNADGFINALLALPSGQLFVGGSFTTFDGQSRKNLAQLNADGSLNSVTYNVNNEVLALAVDSDGRLIVGGDFTVIGASGGGNSNRTHLARLIDSNSSKTRLDFDGDGRSDLGTFNNLNGVWNIHNSQVNQASLTQFGLTNDKTAPADFDGDGKTDIAIYRPSEGNWYLNQTDGGFSVVRWGIAEDIPMPADFDGDGKDDIAVWRPSTGVWYILLSSDNQPQIIQFGLTEDIPLQSADFDGDGKIDIAVWRPSDGNFYWLESGSNNQFKVVHFGQNGDIPTVGDFNGDGKTDLVVFRPTQGVWYQYLTSETGEYTFSAIQFGLNGDEPIVADYDGDGKTDIAIRRQNVWHLLLSGSGHSFTTFGETNTRAIAALSNQ